MAEMWKSVGTIFLLIALFLILSNYTAFNQILESGGNLFVTETGVLQGRTVTGGGFGSPTVGGVVKGNG